MYLTELPTIFQHRSYSLHFFLKKRFSFPVAASSQLQNMKINFWRPETCLKCNSSQWMLCLTSVFSGVFLLQGNEVHFTTQSVFTVEWSCLDYLTLTIKKNCWLSQYCSMWQITCLKQVFENYFLNVIIMWYMDTCGWQKKKNKTNLQYSFGKWSAVK